MFPIVKFLSTMLIYVGLVLADDGPLVELPYGTIRGREAETLEGTNYFAFPKIPFAAPPVGELRFKPPAPPKSWEGILNTTETDVVCYQTTTNSPQESEDCLYLNVYTPQLPKVDEETELLPVLVYIYGGGFVDGNCLEMGTGPDFMVDNGVVFVSLNYRLGIFGFISTQDEVIPGNNGLRDQHAAIKWTHDNIHLFGGDPEKITISGQSAGSASAAYQFLNKNSEGLFRSAILESGSFLSPWAYQRGAREIAFKTASFIDESFSESNDSQKLLEFLLSRTAEELDTAAYNYSQLDNPQVHQISQGFFWAPVVEVEHEDAFFTEKMYVSLSKGNYVKVPILIGVTSEESLFEAEDLDWLRYQAYLFDKNLNWVVPRDMMIDDLDLAKRYGALIRAIYTQGENFRNDLSTLVRYFSDTSFTRSLIRHAELQAKSTDVYFYQFSYDGVIGGVDNLIEGAEKVQHGEELSYIYRTRWSPDHDTADLKKFPEEDVLTHKRLVKIWTDFVKFTNPTPEPSELLQNITWPKVEGEEPDNFAYVDIDVDLTIKNNPKEKTYIGWRALYNNLEYDDFDTY